jgi:glycosyltransferase involved in cell wall biosynthesis
MHITYSDSVTDANKVVIHVLNGFAFGGIEQLCLQILQHPPHNVQNILINLNPERLEMLPAFDQVPNLVILNQPYRSNQKLRFIFHFAATLRQYHPQAVFIYPFSIIHLLVGLAARLAFIPQIAVHAGNTPPHVPSDCQKWKRLIQASRLLQIQIHCCSEVVHANFHTLTPLPRGSFAIPNGCDVDEIATRAKISREKHPASAVKVMGMVARLNAIKDQETLIRAFALVHKKFPKTELWLIGNGEQKEYLQNWKNELKLQNAVTFWGSRSDIPELLGQMDIYAFSTTDKEGFGISLIEAMAASLPIVASDVPACREVLGDGEAGFLVSQGNPEALALVLEKLLSCDEERTNWGKRAYQRAVTHYSIQKCAERWYRALLSGR